MAGTNLGRRAVLGGAALLGAGRFLGSARAQGSPVRIGVLTDESGPYADSGGAGSITAARMAVQDFGKTVLGNPIEIIHADTQNKPDIAGSLAREWYDSGVDAIIDLPVTPVAAAVQNIAREKIRTVMITASAISEFTSKNCAPISSHWADDTHALSTAIGKVVTSQGGDTWFFITVNFSFGEGLQAAATTVIEASGGKVLGSTKFPINNPDFSSQILQAQSSGAKVIGLASVGGDQVNLIKQAAEFGSQVNGKQKLAAFLVYITDIHALGLQVAQGLTFSSSFYWDQNDAARAFAKRFSAERKAMPTKNQASVYAGTLHFLRGMASAGTRDAVAVNKAMRAIPVDFFGRPATLREDGRLLCDLKIYRVKTPAESQAPWDYYTEIGGLPAAEAFLPINPACQT
ncbi:MAG TPA: ABC transporter substrate-binding protein [Stellaceae bacterium]|nr:ABC transporter substrate-binding protein [Stellaceae bacterium]